MIKLLLQDNRGVSGDWSLVVIAMALFVAVGFVAAGAMAVTPTEENEMGVIEGVVTDADGSTVAGAEVIAEVDETQFFDETNTEGYYQISLDPGTYSVWAFDEETGEASETIQVTIESGETQNIDLVLYGDDAPPDEDAPPEDDDDVATITGTVTDQDGDPVIDAWVSAENDEFFAVETDASGHYELEVQPGTYEVFSYSEEPMGASDTHTVSVDAGEVVDLDLEFEWFDDAGIESDFVVDTSVEHVGGTAPSTMPDVESMDSAEGQINIDLVDLSQEQYIQELADLGVDETTEFEIVVEFEDFVPRAVIASAQDVDWELSGSTLTVTAKPLSTEMIDGEFGLDNWPEGEDDQADYSFDAMVNLLVIDLDDPQDEFDPDDHPLTGLTIATDAQVFSTPMYTPGEDDDPDMLEIKIGGPHLSIDGEQNDGLYQAKLPQSLLDEWGVEDPDQLTAAYRGEQTDFEATEVDDGILIEMDVSYSVGTVGISPDTTALTPTPEEGDPAPATPTPEDGAPESGTPTPDDSDSAHDEEDDSIPGPGILGALVGILTAGYLMYCRRDY